MTQAFRNLLYREPRLYDLIFPEPANSVALMIRTAINRWAPVAPQSMLDVGCGTGQHLEISARLSQIVLESTCWSRTSHTPNLYGPALLFMSVTCGLCGLVVCLISSPASAMLGPTP